MQSFIKFLYYKSSPNFQNLYCSLYGIHINLNRYNWVFKKYLKESFESYFLTANEIKQKQNRQLRLVLEVASKTKFWQERFQKYNVDIFEKDLINEIKKLPILSKEEVKANIDKILVPKIYLKRHTKFNIRQCSTSGTTGSGMVFFETNESQAMRWSIWWRYRYLIGINKNTWCGLFGGRSLIPPDEKSPPFWRTNYPCKQVLFSTFHISEENFIYYLDEITKRKLKWLHGYPSALSLLASYALDFQIEISNDLEIITTGAENLFSHQKCLIEKVFKVPVMDHYGQAEGVANFSQISSETYLVDEDYSIVEFIHTNHKDKFRVVGTSLYNLAFPLIRYETQDFVEIKEIEQELNSCWRKVYKIDGRSEDYLLLNDGSKVGRLDQIFKDLIDIVEAQFVQNEKGKVDLYIVPSFDFNHNSQKKLEQLIYEKVGDRLSLKIIKVKKIKRSDSGKLRFVKSIYNI